MKERMQCTLHSKVDQYEDDGFSYHVFSHEDMTSCGYTALSTIEVEFDLPPRDVLIAGAVAAYREEQKRIRAEAQIKVTQLDDAIQRLLCIEHKPG